MKIWIVNAISTPKLGIWETTYHSTPWIAFVTDSEEKALEYVDKHKDDKFEDTERIKWNKIGFDIKGPYLVIEDEKHNSNS